MYICRECLEQKTVLPFFKTACKMEECALCRSMVQCYDIPDFGFSIEKEDEVLNQIDLSKVTRLAIITNKGREFETYDVKKLDIQLQDDKRTLKIFINTEISDTQYLLGYFKKINSRTSKEINRLIVSFDFDGTLTEQPFRHLALNLIEGGAKVLILTSRFKDSLKDVFELAKALNIPPDNVISTNCQDKGDFILEQNLNIDIHFDDDYFEVVSILGKTKTLGVLVNLELFSNK